MSIEVAISKCVDYDEANIKSSFDEILPLVGNLDFVKPGMKIAIKANLVSAMNPDKAATTHPNVLRELCKRLIERGAEVTVGDSPGGPFNAPYLSAVYKITGIDKLKEIGVKLNEDFTSATANFENGKVAKNFQYTNYLKEADCVISFCKLKSHGMMGMSAATKNLFGIIPGTMKPEFHFRYSNYSDFANMLIDLNEFIKPTLCFVDGIIGMEGNGPTAGVPKHIGLLMASKNPYLLDAVCSKIIGLEKENIPTLDEAYKRKLITKEVNEIETNINVDEVVVKDFDTRKVHKRLNFDDHSKIVGKLCHALFTSKPNLSKDECVGCGRCRDVCPAKAITIVDGKATIDRSKCIKCFCCQEFCPKGAMKVKRTWIAKLITK